MLPGVSDAARVRDAILGALPNVKSGTLRIWGDWFGRPHDNIHRITGATADAPRRWYVLDYIREGRVIRGDSNVDWYTPTFQTDPAMPAAELV
jgi:hypothetical protein